MKTVRLKLLFVCAVMLLLNVTPVAFGLVVGFNPDIHMDIQGVIANDFHVQGRIESGDVGGNWSRPPVLISHIDGGFTNFKYSITPDPCDPDQNWYNFTADWSGTNYQFCTVIHLGLFFDAECHNVAVNLVGWWTQNGVIPVPPLPFPPPMNGGAVLIPGFNVQDMPHPGMPQMISLFNHSREGGGGGGGGIYAQVVQMDVVGLTKEELESKLGPIPQAFKELCVDGNQAILPWVPVENEYGPISETNPQPFPVDSFFDVFFDIGYPIHTAEPVQIPAGGFLVARERVKYINNAGQPDIRWDWMIHMAHESDLGDAPDSTNSFGVPPPLVLMTAYPKGGPMNIQANYPTVYQAGSPPYGPIHWAAPLIAFLGPMVSPEMEADIGPDIMDGVNNIIPPQDTPDLDGFDDGVIFPIVMPHCQQTTFDYWVTIMFQPPPPMPQVKTLYVNVWCDWNRDGDWDDTMQCPGTTAPIPAPEWAVQNQVIAIDMNGINGLPPGMHKITTPPFMPWHPATGDVGPIWMRITLSEQRWAPISGVLGDGGCGPQYGYLYGETEDYYFVPEVPQPPKLDFGDAPEGYNAIAYPATGVTGAFPTCMTIGPAGWIQHTNFGAWFGLTVDFEGDGNGGLCPGCFPPYDQDECFADGDAGLIVPQPYTIDAALNVVPCPLCSGGGTPLGDTCQTAFWGTNIDIYVHNNMPSDTNGYVNLLIDWDQNGQWGGSSSCPTAVTPEHVLVNFPVPNPYDGRLSGLMPFGAGFLIGPNRGYVWARFTITDQKVPDNWNGEGYFEDGETEDYLLEIGKVYEPKPPVEHVKWSQPPIEWNPQSRTPLYCGWDEKSFRESEPIWFDAWDCRTQCHGDADCDGDVDVEDLVIVKIAFGTVYPNPNYDPRADFNRDLRINATDLAILESYLGMNPPADCGQNPQNWMIVADDFRCLGSMPVTSIHWWGSYIGWQESEPPPVKPTSWRIGFWSNVPAPVGGGFSHPGKLLWQIEVSADRVQENWSGIDQFPDTIPETCFQYYVNLTPNEYFRQAKEEPNTVDSVFWLSIAAIYPPGASLPNPWGWKTRPWHWMDDAVTFTIQGEFKPGYVPDPSIFRPLEYCGQSYDAAFELDTDPNYIKWEQAYTGIRDWPHYEDEESTAIEHRFTDKWLQPPDLTPPMPPNPPTGIGVDMFWAPLADDFKCSMTGPMNCIRMWGCFAQDLLPKLGPGSLTFRVTIYADIPAKPPDQPFSKPGNVLWQKVFNAGEYTVTELNPVLEGWYDPATNLYQPNDHQRIFQYDFHVPSTVDPFLQQAGTIYWLEVKDLPFPPPDPDPRDYTFGWKTTLIQNRWNDDAVWNYWLPNPQPPLVPGWNPLLYPPRHPYANTTLDLAFELMTEKNELITQRQVFDDWLCQMRSPVTAIVWWGSYIGYRYEACQCQTTTPQPTKPDYFLLSIWDNVPANTSDPCSFSHPGTKVWEYKANNYDEVLVGYDKHPEPGESGYGYEPVFRYSVKLPDPNWFRQKDVNEVFWLSVMAVYKDPVSPIVYPWGWTNHQCMAWEPKGLNDEVAYWKLNETSGIIASDSSGNGNDGTLVGNPTWTAGKICGGALDVNGNGDYVKTADTTTGLNFAPGSFSVSAWIYPRQVTGGWRTILEYDRDGTNRNRFGMWLSTDSKFHFRVGWDTFNSTQTINANEWCILTGTYDSTTKLMSVYINGQFDSSLTHTTGFSSPYVTKATIGVRGSEDGEYFNGLLDDIRIYNRTLSASEVQALADMGKNDDAAAWEQDPTGMWRWIPLMDQTVRSEDMSFILFTEPGCFPSCHEDYFDWLAMGKPNCWCYLRQCHGDADDKTEGSPKSGYYYVHFNDLNVLLAGWNVREPALPPIPSGPGIQTVIGPGGVPCVCADFGHDQEGSVKSGYYRVHFNDLNILLASWNIREPAPPPIPSGPGIDPNCLNCP